MKAQISEKTGKEIEKNLNRQTDEILGEVMAQDRQYDKDLAKFVYIVGILGPILASFQAFKIFFSQSAAGVSLVYWFAYLAIAGMWFTYGIMQKNKAIMLTYGLWIAVEVVILNGIFYYS